MEGTTQTTDAEEELAANTGPHSAVCVVDDQHCVVKAGGLLCRELGYAAGDLIGRPFTTLLANGNRARLKRLHARFLTAGSPERTLRLELKRTDGTRLEATATLLRLEARLTVINVAIAGGARRAPDYPVARRSGALLAAAQDGFWDWNLASGEMWMSPHWKAQLGYADDEIPNTAEAWRELIFAEDAQAAGQLVEDFNTGRIARFDTLQRFRHKAGHTVWMRSRAVTLRDAAGRVIRLVGSNVDITDLMQIQEALEVSQAQMTGILDSAHDAIIALDADLKITTFNKGAERIFGWPAAEMLANELDRLLPQDARRHSRNNLLALMAGPTINRTMAEWRPTRGLHRDGHEFPLLSSISKISVFGQAAITVIYRDMSEEARTAAELIELAEEKDRQLRRAEEANNAKSQFLAVMSHELRTPLNAIIGFSEIMEGEYLGPLGSPRYMEYVRDIRRSGGHLLALINDVLDLARIEAQAIHLNIEPVDVMQEVVGLVTLMRPQADRKQLSLESIPALPMPRVKADRRAVRQIILNLLSNAIKFTRSGGRIEISGSLQVGRREVDLIIRDTGIGIPSDKLKDLGLPFMQIEDAYRTSEGGTGLGLAIVKSLAEAMSFRLSIDSELGKGTTVTIAMPLAEAVKSG